MRVQRGRRQRGYALAEAMVGGVVLMFAVGGLTAGFVQARAHVMRALDDRLAAQLAAAQVEQLRAFPVSHNPKWTAPSSYACSLAEAPAAPLPPFPALPAPPTPLPTGWTCTVAIRAVNEAAQLDSFSGEVIVPARTYKVARITLNYRSRQWVVETMQW